MSAIFFLEEDQERRGCHKELLDNLFGLTQKHVHFQGTHSSCWIGEKWSQIYHMIISRRENEKAL